MKNKITKGLLALAVTTNLLQASEPLNFECRFNLIQIEGDIKKIGTYLSLGREEDVCRRMKFTAKYIADAIATCPKEYHGNLKEMYSASEKTLEACKNL